MPDDPIHVYESSDPGVLPVREDANGAPAVIGSEPYLIAGVYLQAPIPVVITSEASFLNEAGQLMDVIPVNLGGVPSGRQSFLTTTSSLGLSAHSLLEQAAGTLVDQWDVQNYMNYLGWSSLKARWDSNGIDRTGPFTGGMVVTEIGDFDTGVADPNSDQGRETLQYLYWYALMAQAKGCTLFVIYPPWTPEANAESFDDDTLSKCLYWKQWLEARPEITLEVWVVPIPQVVRRIREYFAPDSIFYDGLHMNNTEEMNPTQGVGFALFSTITGEKGDITGLDQEGADLAELAWQVVLEYASTGLGGSTVVPVFPVATDPLPNPLPLPT